MRLRHLAVALAMLATPAHADIYRPPVGFEVFCLLTPTHCQGGGADVVEASNAVMATLEAVNVGVNSAITYTSEPGDRWMVDVTHGDCEDYALTKRAQLIAAGLPASALRLGLAKTRGQYHVVLIVRTNAGRYVLDNLTDAILPIEARRMQWIATTTADGLTWIDYHRE